jgi:hypothetical protein
MNIVDLEGRGRTGGTLLRELVEQGTTRCRLRLGAEVVIDVSRCAGLGRQQLVRLFFTTSPCNMLRRRPQRGDRLQDVGSRPAARTGL